MAGEVALSPSQVKKDGQWQPIRDKIAQSQRPSPPNSPPRRLSSVTAKLKRRPLSPINEDKVSSLNSDSSISLRLKSALPYQPSTRSHSTEHLIYIHPSRQLQKYQSVSSQCTNEAYASTPRLYRTQSQRTALPESYLPSGIPICQVPSTVETCASTLLETDDTFEPGADPMPVDEDLPREAIADLFHRVEEYERQHPEKINDAGKVWVRVSEVGQGLTKTFKTMGSMHKKHTFETRHDYNEPKFPARTIPIRSQIKIYEKPTRSTRMSIAMRDCWRRFRNWTTGRDTELKASRIVTNRSNPVMNVSIVSLNLADPFATTPRTGPRKLSRVGKVVERTDGDMYAWSARKDSKHSIGEQLKGRKSSLFLDIYPSDSSVGG